MLPNWRSLSNTNLPSTLPLLNSIVDGYISLNFSLILPRYHWVHFSRCVCIYKNLKSKKEAWLYDNFSTEIGIQRLIATFPCATILFSITFSTVCQKVNPKSVSFLYKPKPRQLFIHIHWIERNQTHFQFTHATILYYTLNKFYSRIVELLTSSYISQSFFCLTNRVSSS